ncbi:DNA glycosylase [Entophlyctis helioformis]|nr:DNA glycosylase [Entophlyctis helioformis]
MTHEQSATEVPADTSRLHQRLAEASGGVHHAASYHDLGSDETAAIRHDLLQWYAAHGRQLPWRAKWDSQKAAGDSNWLAQRAYVVWVSEMMLQQTQVSTVVPYFASWMSRWPTVADLAAASLEDVNRVWAGLGYYSRARRLHEGACLVVDRFAGMLPRTPEELQKSIPGVGPYTAGAIASIAFNVRAPVVDGNVVRVVSRLAAFGADPKAKEAIKVHWKLAEQLVDPDHPGDFNQALMDLGATVCTPKTPSCGACPLQSHCKAFQESTLFGRLRAASPTLAGSQCKAETVSTDHVCTLCVAAEVDDMEDWPVTRYPTKTERKQPRLQQCDVSLVEHMGHPVMDASKAETVDNKSVFMVVKGGETGLLAGLWDFPMTVTEDIDPSQPPDSDSRSQPSQSQSQSQSSQRSRGSGRKKSSQSQSQSQPQSQETESTSGGMDDLLARLLGPTMTVVGQKPLGALVHVFSHIRRTMIVRHVQVRGHAPSAVGADKQTRMPAVQWVTLDDLKTGSVAVPTAVKKVIHLFENPGSGVVVSAKPVAAKAGGKRAGQKVAAVAKRGRVSGGGGGGGGRSAKRKYKREETESEPDATSTSESDAETDAETSSGSDGNADSGDSHNEAGPIPRRAYR